MTAEELINHMIPPLKTTDTAQKALKWMEELRINQLPVIEDKSYKGLISESALLESGGLDKPVSDFRLDFVDIYTAPSTHFYDVIKQAMLYKLQILAVVNSENKYQGAISVSETAGIIAQMFASQGPGGILVLSMKENDYSLAQISRLIESNDTKILSAFVVTDEMNPSLIKLTLKLNRVDLTRIVATLERYDYRIIAQFQDVESLSNEKERLDLLFKYLNI